MNNDTPRPSAAPRLHGTKREEMGLMMSVQLAWELGYVIAGPIVLLGFGGAYVDKYLDTSPTFLFGGFILAFCISAFFVLRKVRAIHRMEFGDQNTSPNRSLSP